ncbi:hypothetical protein FXO38_19876 [Capsicum annuum]|nr:hypothetical protein FXO38_19876 [Capsicum annuum]
MVAHSTGLFGLIVDPTSVGNQIVKSINLSRDGIHDVPLVLSIQTRFTREEQTVVQAFQKFFGTRISDYMIVVFTGVGEIKYGDFDVLISCVFPEHLMISEGDVTTQVPKTKKELDDVDRKKIEKNYNAKKIIVCSISPDENLDDSERPGYVSIVVVKYEASVFDSLFALMADSEANEDNPVTLHGIK